MVPLSRTPIKRIAVSPTGVEFANVTTVFSQSLESLADFRSTKLSSKAPSRNRISSSVRFTENCPLAAAGYLYLKAFAQTNLVSQNLAAYPAKALPRRAALQRPDRAGTLTTRPCRTEEG